LVYRLPNAIGYFIDSDMECDHMVNKFLISALAAVLLIAGFQYWQNGKLQAKTDVLIANNTVLDSAVKTQNQTITTLQTAMNNVIKNNAALAAAQQQVSEQTNQALAKLETYNGRLNNAALEKPTLIERRANAAFSDVMRQFAAATSHASSEH